MKKMVFRGKLGRVAIIALATGLIIWACSTVPLTGRRQLSLVADSEINALSFNQYDEFLKENKLSTNAQQTAMIKNVGKKISAAVESYLSQNGMSDRIEGFEWEFNLVDDATPNAWCMPGGKVVFYTGILPICQDETGIAVVMGHEIAHAVAKHGSERMSQQMAAEFGSATLSALLAEQSETTQQLAQLAFGVGTQYGVLLPYSRTHETEADRLGLIFMAVAGYDPSTAIGFWQRMAEISGGANVPQFLSTHPSNTTRISNLQSFLPEALQYFKK